MEKKTKMHSLVSSVPFSLPVAVDLRVEGDRPGDEVHPSNYHVDDDEDRIVDNGDSHIGILNTESKRLQ